ncbi:MAG: AbrB/MazE/SpoVT family DNA-binding domain-containing protein [Chloroflexota bacterium]|nr:AbrB/MazE/SpoVT family DNA-binding domain-containing protein [Anaerolineales bacterium]MCA9976111.1 AbrB/MazE/SpoVT family DNA-binding domain-containing protein [Anaerolineales bacterium]MCB8966726.1 AbrB/MazE/SpoVT family DNA-binding domain-containing protein [Ardenticatenaceae bacterium]
MLVKVGQRGQVTIPKSIRQKLGIEPGDNLVILFKSNEIVLQPVTETIFDLVGNIPVPPEGPYTIEALREASAKYIAEHVLDTDE